MIPGITAPLGDWADGTVLGGTEVGMIPGTTAAGTGDGTGVGVTIPTGTTAPTPIGATVPSDSVKAAGGCIHPGCPPPQAGEAASVQ